MGSINQSQGTISNHEDLWKGLLLTADKCRELQKGLWLTTEGTTVNCRDPWKRWYKKIRILSKLSSVIPITWLAVLGSINQSEGTMINWRDPWKEPQLTADNCRDLPKGWQLISDNCRDPWKRWWGKIRILFKLISLMPMI